MLVKIIFLNVIEKQLQLLLVLLIFDSFMVDKNCRYHLTPWY